MSDTPRAVCPCCGREMPQVERRQRRTLYHDDELNYLTSCEDCYADDCEYYNELWTDYFQSRL